MCEAELSHPHGSKQHSTTTLLVANAEMSRRGTIHFEFCLQANQPTGATAAFYGPQQAMKFAFVLTTIAAMLAVSMDHVRAGDLACGGIDTPSLTPAPVTTTPTPMMTAPTPSGLAKLESSNAGQGQNTAWSGYFVQSGTQYPMTLSFDFSASGGSISGRGQDLLAQFTIDGSFTNAAPLGPFTFSKHYPSHSVLYSGSYDGTTMAGSWTLNGMTGAFQMAKKLQ